MSKPSVWIAGTVLAGVALLGFLAEAPVADASTVDLSVALDEQQRLVAVRTTDAPAHNDLGNLLAASGRWDEAETAYRTAITLDPLYVDAYYNLGILLQQVDRADEARDQYLDLLDIDPGYAWAQYQLGKILEDRGSDDRAIERYARAFARDPMLSFAEINPHVIDSHLITEALLRSDRYRSEAALAPPRQYAEGSRIVGLLVDDSDRAEALAATNGSIDRLEEGDSGRSASQSDGLPQPGDLGSRPVFPEAAAQDPLPEETTSEAARVLGNDDLDPSDEGGRVVGGGIVSRPSTRGRAFSGSNARRPTNSRSATPRTVVPQPIERSGSRATNPSAGSAGARSNTTIGGSTSSQGGAASRGRYRPSARSTAQLDLRLEPVRVASVPHRN